MTPSLESVIRRHPALAPCAETMTEAFLLLRESLARGGKVLACGNGGSAADAEHIVGELMKGFNLTRPLTATQVAALKAVAPEDGEAIAAKLQQGMPAVSLVSQTALITAIANDTDPELIFAQQVLGLGRPGDVLIALSTSGNSKNVVKAAKVARAFGLKVVSLTGEGGGQLAPLADAAIRVPSRQVFVIQEMHLPVYHWLCAELETAFYAAPASGLPKAKLPDPVGLVVFDFDGVLTDNKVYTAQDGTEMVACDRGDSLGLDYLRAAGIPMMILSTEANPVVAARAAKLKLPVEQACGDKAAWLSRHLADKGIDPASVIYLGNDLNDRAAMELVGFAVAPADAHSEIKAISSLVLTRAGGQGAVREFADHLLSRSTKV